MMVEKRGVFLLRLKGYLGLFDLIAQVNDEWRGEVSSAREAYSVEADAQIKVLYQTWLSLSDPVRQRMEFYERQGLPIETVLYTNLRLYTQEVARILADWQAPAAQGQPVPPKARKYTLAQLLAGVTLENRHAEVQTGPSIGKEAW